MKMEWTKYIDHNLNVTLNENYGVVYDTKKETPHFFEIVFKAGKLLNVYEEGLLLEAVKENQIIRTFVPFTSIKCVDIF